MPRRPGAKKSRPSEWLIQKGGFACYAEGIPLPRWMERNSHRSSKKFK